MRIISQSGDFDFPYEQIVIQRFVNNKIYVLNENLTGVEKIVNDFVIAEYSTEEKAIKAMEMLRETYDKGLYVDYPKIDESNVAEDDSVTLFRVESAKFYPDGYYKNCKVFQFPQDDEIEV
jgi:hypothetical protein